MSEKALEFELEFPVPLERLWEAWTSSEGIKSFFAPDCNLEIKPGGAYEIFFFPENPIGMRGADSQIVLAVEEFKLLSFSWNFPPSLPEIREQRTTVILRFSGSAEKSRLHFCQIGWGEGEAWERGFEYFSKAWGEVVLPRLSKSLQNTTG